MMWFLAFVFNGLHLLSYEPFDSEEACVLAAKAANIATFDCLPVPALEDKTDPSERD